jgi:AcrR family transcriptional regulator
MARPRKFDELHVIDASMSLFAQNGFNATSVDDLLEATGLLRGSLYKAFGSKLNVFLIGFKSCVDSFDVNNSRHLDLLTVALRDLAQVDDSTKELCRLALTRSPSSLPMLLGNNLINRLEN